MDVNPQLLIFDVNETLSDLSPLGQRFEDLGAPALLAKVWFASTLRDGFALTAVGDNPSFAELAKDVARGVLTGEGLDRSVEEAVEHVMAGLTGLGVHPDVAEGIPALADTGVRMVTLSNGSAGIAKGLLERAGLVDHFEHLLSVEDAAHWKPAAAPYQYALATCNVAAEDAMLVAVHPWDIDGAHRAGLRTAWVDRTGAPYPSSFADPDLRATSMVDLAGQLA